MTLAIEPTEYNKFFKSLTFTLSWEGGYVNDPKDPGGETKYGISKRYHPYLDIKNLTAERASEIFYNEYWLVSGCDDFDFPLCAVLFDTAVNLGVTRAVGILKACAGDSKKMIQFRKDYYVTRVKQNPAKQKYLAGWLHRCNDLLKLVTLASTPSNPKSPGKVVDQGSRSRPYSSTQCLT